VAQSRAGVLELIGFVSGRRSDPKVAEPDPTPAGFVLGKTVWGFEAVLARGLKKWPTWLRWERWLIIFKGRG
jgi:hypothetical protein